MDPFSIATGAVGLADAGTSLASFLTDKYKSYRDAPELILETANEVEFCAGLVDMFGSNLDRPGAEYPERFVRDAKNLVRRTNAVFLDIRGLIPIDRDFDAPFSRARWHFVLDKKKLMEHQQRLRQLQQMFMFMETMHRYHYPTNSKPSGGVISGQSQDGNAAEQTFQGLMDQQGPMRLNGVGADGRSFEVTLTLKPVKQVEAVPMSAPVPMPEIESRSGLSFAVPARSTLSKKRLEGLRRSPFFDMDLLESEKPGPRLATTYSETMPASYTRSSHNKLDAERMEMEKKGRSARSREDASAEQNFPQPRIVDDDVAERDVEALRQLWFGPPEDDQADDDDAEALELQPMVSVDDVNDSSPSRHQGAGEPVRYNMPEVQYIQPPPVEPRYSSPNISERLLQPTSARSSYVSHSSTGTVLCDGCDREVGSPNVFGEARSSMT